MRPYLVAMLVEQAAYVGIVGVNIDFACSYDVGSNVAHVAEVIEDVKAIVAKTQAVDILKIDPEDVVRFQFQKLGSPGVVVM